MGTLVAFFPALPLSWLVETATTVGSAIPPAPLSLACPSASSLLAISHSFSARLGYLKELHSWEILCTFSVLILAPTPAFKLFAVDSTPHNS